MSGHDDESGEGRRYPSHQAERFIVRLPDGLRDRIKAYAARHGRSMNAEIVRILEREFPEPVSVRELVSQIGEAVDVLKAAPSDKNLGAIASMMEGLLQDIRTGRLTGLSATAQSEMADELVRLEEDHLQSAAENYELDDEESDQMYRSGTTAKIVVTPPKRGRKPKG